MKRVIGGNLTIERVPGEPGVRLIEGERVYCTRYAPGCNPANAYKVFRAGPNDEAEAMHLRDIVCQLPVRDWRDEKADNFGYDAYYTFGPGYQD